jgi:hypothetical protein
VINEKFPAYPGSGMNFDAGDKAGDLGSEATKEEQSVCPEPVGDSVHPDRMQSGVAEKNFHNITSSRVTVKNRINILSHPGKHLSPPEFTPQLLS